MDGLVGGCWLWSVLCVFPYVWAWLWGNGFGMGWMHVKVVGVWLGWLRLSCGLGNSPFDGWVGWWLLALECVMCFPICVGMVVGPLVCHGVDGGNCGGGVAGMVAVKLRFGKFPL